MTTDAYLTKCDCSKILGNVPNDTMDKLEIYLELLRKWQKAINLVGPKSLDDAWRRHILDSAQLVPEIETGKLVADLGSGAGLPGLVIAIMTDADVHLVESDQRKATFIREVARETNTDVQVHVARIEDLQPLNAHIITARALAPLPRLLPWVYRHLAAGGKSLLMKGGDVDEELTKCTKQWTMQTVRKSSISDVSGTILVINDLSPLTHD